MLHRRLIAYTIMSAGLHMQAQAQTFNKRFDLFSEMKSQTAWSVEVGLNGEAIVFFNGDYVLLDTAYGSGVSTVVVTGDGLFSQAFRLHMPGRSSYPGWANCSAPLDTGGYVIFGATDEAPDTQRLCIYWCDDAGHVIQHRELSADIGSWIGRGGMQAADGGFLLVGESYPGSGFDALLVKTDAQGNVEWYRTYGSPGLRESLTCIVPAPWGGYYIGGQRELSPWQWHSWIVSVDSLGNVIGEDTYTLGQYRSGNAQLTLAPNGNVWVASAEALGPGDYAYQAALYEVDPQGNLVWHKQIGHVYRSALFVTHQVLGTTDLISVGFDDRTNLIEPLMGILLRTTATGDSIWMRSYAYHDSVVALGNAGFYDMQPTPDGGFMAVGFAEAIWQQGPSGWEQVLSRDVWVVKTDSMGCIEPGCHLITGMETQITNLRGALSVAPNPVASGGTVQVSIALPEGFTPQGALRLTLTSSDGRVLGEWPLREGTTTLNFINLQPSTGLHHLHLHDAARWISGTKLVVE